MTDKGNSLRDRLAVVTGGGRGIGRAVVRELAARGAEVLFTYRSSEEESRELIAELAGKGRTVRAARVDIADDEGVKRFFRTVREDSDYIDILINNAAIARDAYLMLMKEENWLEVINTNLNGTYRCIREVVRPMVSRKYGRIINIVSHSALTGRAAQTNYAASKGGVIGLTRALARELASYNILVNAVSPGLIDTDMIKGIPEKELNAVIAGIPMRRMGKPAEIAPLVGFLASDDNTYITGQVMRVDGGLLI